MNTQTFAHAQAFTAINDDELIAVNGGGLLGDIVDIGVGLIPGVGTANSVAGLTGYSVGNTVEGLFS